MTQQKINNEIYEERYKRFKPVSIDEVKQYVEARLISLSPAEKILLTEVLIRIFEKYKLERK